jgi:hypothetical protein
VELEAMTLEVLLVITFLSEDAIAHAGGQVS